MSTLTFGPPLTSPSDASRRLAADGYVALDSAALVAIADTDRAGLDALVVTWSDLPPDGYLKDGGRYRRRRHSSYVVDHGTVEPVAHRAHWQPVEYNALHGGMQRWFEPIVETVATNAAWLHLLRGLGRFFDHGALPTRWFVEAHQFRIDTANGIGRPTPEGAHRDGVDFVAVVLIGRQGVKGGETRVFEAAGPHGQRFTMVDPWTTLLLDDARVLHETTPVQPTGDRPGTRDTLVLTYRRGGFQGDGA